MLERQVGLVPPLSPGRHTNQSKLMDQFTNSNVIIGSRLALAMSMAIRSPVRRSFGIPSIGKSVELTKIYRRCEALKNRSLKLLDELKEEDGRIAFDAARMRNSADREATRRIGKVMGKVMKQQISLHSKMEKLLDAMMLQIGGDNDTNS